MSVEQWQQEQGDQGSVNQAFSVLAAPERRRIIEFFQKTDHQTVSVQGLVDVCTLEGVGNGHGNTTDHLVTTLHHQHLPKMDDADVIEYDREAERVRYQGDSLIEDLIETVPGTNLRSSQ